MKQTSDKSGGGLTLSPRQEGPVGTTRFGSPGSHWNQADRRTQTDRRLVYDRRELIRFEDDRRDRKDRRAVTDPWAI